MLKLTSLNLNGIRSASSKGLENWLKKHNPDILCVQELKAQEADIKNKFETLHNLKGYFHFASSKKGYSGVGIYTRKEPDNIIIGFNSKEFDPEGRYIELQYNNNQEKYSIISSYFPSGSSGEERQEAKYRFLDEIYPHLINLSKERKIILCGDINIAHNEIDLKNFKGNKKNSGFLPEERQWLTKFLTEGGFDDVYRKLYPTATEECYTWWSNRGQAYAKNVGWRLDYHFTSHALSEKAIKSEIYKDEKFSDHAPITIEYNMEII